MQLADIIKQEFQLDDDIIYLNHAAVSPWPRRTADAVKAFAEENCSKGASNYLDWLQKDSLLRQQCQKLVNAPSVDDIGLLKNTSEALSVVASGIQWQTGDNVVSTDEEFPSNRIPWLAQAAKGVKFKEVSISDIENAEQRLIEACDEQTRLLTVSSVQYGSGRRLNLDVLGNFCRDNGVLFCVDAIQSLGVLRMDVLAAKADFVMADAHKWMLGPEGIALFYCREEIRDQLQLHQFGWHMVENAGNYDQADWQPAASAKRFECGSPNMLGIYAMSASLALIESVGIDTISELVLKNTQQVIDFVDNRNDITLLTPAEAERRAGIVTFRIEHHDNADIYRQLMQSNVVCANRKGGIRLSPHFYTSPEKIQNGLEIIDSII
ncbi:MAG: aminotransferase class V-fold PLP-dependent enzyme [Gammaproteobacteria bacterium]